MIHGICVPVSVNCMITTVVRRRHTCQNLQRQKIAASPKTLCGSAAYRLVSGRTRNQRQQQVAVRLPAAALSGAILGNLFTHTHTHTHTCASVIQQYKLVPA